MIYTLQKWPDVLTTVIELYTDSKEIVLQDTEQGLLLCLSEQSIVLPCQDAFTQFCSQPTSVMSNRHALLNDYPFIVVDLQSNLVKLVTAEHARKIKAGTFLNNAFNKQKLAFYQQHVTPMTQRWMHSVMEYLPLDEDETFSLHMLKSRVAQQ